MLSSSSLSVVSTCITYFVQIAFGYLAAFAVCVLIRTPRVRLRVWGCFLFFTVARWLMLYFYTETGGATQLPSLPVSLQGSSGLGWSWPMIASWAPYLGLFGAWAGRLYLAILALTVPRVLLNWLQLQDLVHNAQRPSSELLFLFQKLCREMKVTCCKLRLVSELRSPATACWWRPYVLLPTELVPQLTDSELTDILRHEITHVGRRDYIWDLPATLGCRVVFFHPAVWLAHRRLRWERELACDEAVVQGRGEGRLQYAECLAKLARWLFLAGRRSPDGVGFATSASLLATRVHALLSEPSPCSIYERVGRVSLVTLVVMISACLLPGTGLTLYWSTPLVSMPAQSRSARLPSVRGLAVARKRSQAQPRPDLKAGLSRTQPEPKNASSIFADLSSKPLPVLGSPSPSVASAAERKSRSIRDADDQVASHPVWDESQMPRPLATAPDWRKLATDAITGGVLVMRGGGGGSEGGETRDGQSGQQGNHLR